MCVGVWVRESVFREIICCALSSAIIIAKTRWSSTTIAVCGAQVNRFVRQSVSGYNRVVVIIVVVL